jgi:hypothetical protein
VGTVKRYFSVILIVTLATSIIFLSGCGGKGSYSIDDVLNSFSRIAGQRTLADRQNVYPWWSANINQGSVKHITDGDYYQIEFPGMSGASFSPKRQEVIYLIGNNKGRFQTCPLR